MGVQPLGQLLNGLRQARLFDAVPKLFRVDILSGLGDIFRHGHVQNGELLKYGAEARAFRDANLTAVGSFQPHQKA